MSPWPAWETTGTAHRHLCPVSACWAQPAPAPERARDLPWAPVATRAALRPLGRLLGGASLPRTRVGGCSDPEGNKAILNEGRVVSGLGHAAPAPRAGVLGRVCSALCPWGEGQPLPGAGLRGPSAPLGHGPVPRGCLCLGTRPWVTMDPVSLNYSSPSRVCAGAGVGTVPGTPAPLGPWQGGGCPQAQEPRGHNPWPVDQGHRSGEPWPQAPPLWPVLHLVTSCPEMLRFSDQQRAGACVVGTRGMGGPRGQLRCRWHG